MLNKKVTPANSKRPEMLRLFYALIPDEQTKNELQRWQAKVTGSKTPRENLHMTLFFMGNQPQKKLEIFRQFIDNISFTQFDIELDRLGHFSKIGLSWIGPHLIPSPLSELFRNTREFMIPAHAEDKKEKFRPHITLARRSSVPEVNIIDTPLIWRVNRLVLMQSILNRLSGQQPEYRILHERTSFSSPDT